MKQKTLDRLAIVGSFFLLILCIYQKNALGIIGFISLIFYQLALHKKEN